MHCWHLFTVTVPFSFSYFSSGNMAAIFSTVNLISASYSQNVNQWPVKYFIHCWRWNKPCQVLKDKENRLTEHERFKIPVSAVKIETMNAREWAIIIMLDNKILMRFVHTSSGKTLDWISWQRAPVHVPVSQLGILTSAITCTSSLTLINTHSQYMEQHTRLTACHYRASSKYSNSIRGDTKGFIRADELHSWVPFFLLPLIAAISGHVGEMAPDSSFSYKWAHLLYLCLSGSWHHRNILCMQMLHVVCFKGWMSSTPQTSSCLFIFTISSNDLCQGGFDSWRLSSSCSSGLHIVVGMSSFCFSEYQLEWVVEHVYTLLL